MKTEARNWFRRGLITVAAAGIALVIQNPRVRAAESAVLVPAPVVDQAASTKDGKQKAVFAGGCFWGVQGVFQHVKGVRQAVSGYAGGAASTAHYRIVGTGVTGHAEAVEVTYDPKEITYGQLLQIFFSVAHDPTQLDRQGPDSGSQYRSEIFTTDAEQKRIADSYVAQLDKAKIFPAPIVTRIEPLPAFYAAEDYHQDYLTLNPDAPYIAINDMPKVDNLKRLFADRYRSRPVLVSSQ